MEASCSGIATIESTGIVIIAINIGIETSSLSIATVERACIAIVAIYAGENALPVKAVIRSARIVIEARESIARVNTARQRVMVAKPCERIAKVIGAEIAVITVHGRERAP